ncbi:MAG: hypothetical protein AAF821_01895 [Cyanobacteria bacterium P01_D01_bin.156]
MTLMQDKKAGEQTYPENVNYALYELIWALGLVAICISTAMVLITNY